MTSHSTPAIETYSAAPALFLGTRLYPVGANHIALLKSIENPLLMDLVLRTAAVMPENHAVKAALIAKAEKLSFEIEDTYDFWYVLSLSDDESANVPAPAVRLATITLMDTSPPWPPENLKEALLDHFRGSVLMGMLVNPKIEAG